MKPEKRSRSVAALAVLGVAILVTSCGSSNNSAAAAAAAAAASSGLTAGGCVPITSQIPFTGQGIYFSGINIVGGLLPGSGTPIGQVVIGGGATSAQFQRSGVDGTIVMSLVAGASAYSGQYPVGYPNSIYPGTLPGTSGLTGALGSTVTGMLQISQATQQDIVNQALQGAFGTISGLTGLTGIGSYPYGGTGYPYGYGNTNYTTLAQTVCVSGIAFNLGEYNGLLYGGNVYLYMNGTQHGYILYF